VVKREWGGPPGFCSSFPHIGVSRLLFPVNLSRLEQKRIVLLFILVCAASFGDGFAVGVVGQAPVVDCTVVVMAVSFMG
jgi:hypothetical protein